MSTHPNAILKLTLTPHNLSRKTMRDILSQRDGVDPDEYEPGEIKIGNEEYQFVIMESEYDLGFQISSKQGDLIFLDMVTYGYGEEIEWSKLEFQKNALEQWAKEMCEKHFCDYKISICSNYW